MSGDRRWTKNRAALLSLAIVGNVCERGYKPIAVRLQQQRSAGDLRVTTASRDDEV
jgi:hypothetical protein